MTGIPIIGKYGLRDFQSLGKTMDAATARHPDDGRGRPLRYSVSCCFRTLLLLSSVFCLLPSPADATIRYVSHSGGNIPPYTDWGAAATNIQDAIDVCEVGDIVLVTNGTYATGGRVVNGTLANRIAVTNGLTVQSVNGPDFTTISGSKTRDDDAVRCAFIGFGSTLDGFRLRDGGTRTNGDFSDQCGGGAFCEYAATLSNCRLSGNAALFGGGAYGGTLHRCAIVGNTALNGGGAYNSELHDCHVSRNRADTGGGTAWSTLRGCTVVANDASQGGGIWEGSAFNSIIYDNQAADGWNFFFFATSPPQMSYCCTDPWYPGDGIVVQPPLLAGVANPHLLSNSPCIDTGDDASSWSATDIDGNERIAGARIDIGCDEFIAAGATGALDIAISAQFTNNIIAGYPVMFETEISGVPDNFAWDMGDGTVVASQSLLSHTYYIAGTYDVVLSAWNADGTASATLTVQVAAACLTNYVSLTGSHTPPFHTWATASTTLQAAVDAVIPGGVVLVAEGRYASGGSMSVQGPNRVTLDKPVVLQAINPDPALTVIAGDWSEWPPPRCAYVGPGATLTGFTLTNGSPYCYPLESQGGGAWCDVGGVVTNCIITGNFATRGGGVYGQPGSLIANCLIQGNYAGSGGGSASSTLYRCTIRNNSAGYGGGVFGGEIYNCTISSNKADWSGGGAYGEYVGNGPQGESLFSAGLYDCIVSGNSVLSSGWGGGLYGCTAYNCTLAGNSASYGGGASFARLYNSIVYFNHALIFPNSDAWMFNCCTWPMSSYGSNNIASRPRFVGVDNPHLTAQSSCIDQGDNSAVSWDADMDEESRINGVVDMGADEFWPTLATGVISATIGIPGGTCVVVGQALPLESRIDGRPIDFTLDFGDGMIETDETVTAHSWLSAGYYDVVLHATNMDFAASATVTIRVVNADDATRYVTTNGNDAASGTNWLTAKRTIQAAVNETVRGGLVLVSNGCYDAGGMMRDGITNRVVITNAITVRSINGSSVTSISGLRSSSDAWIGWGPRGLGPDAIRGVFMADGAALEGFKLSNGATDSGWTTPCFGGAALCSDDATISNCIFISNMASEGGAVCGGQIYNSPFLGNEACNGGGALFSTLFNCIFSNNTAAGDAGGAEQSTLYHCKLMRNHSGAGGGGCNVSKLYNCVLWGNSTDTDGGGSRDGTLFNCTVVNNEAVEGGGIWGGQAYNSIVYFNNAISDPDWWSGTQLQYCCAPNSFVTNTPMLSSMTDPHLTDGSPCIGQADPAIISWATDIDGEVRNDGFPDIGADEYWPTLATDSVDVEIGAPRGLNVVAGSSLPFESRVSGRPTMLIWDFGDGNASTNTAMVSHSWSNCGIYRVILSATNMAGYFAATASVRVLTIADATIFVSTNGTDMAPGTSWAASKRTLQAGVDAAIVGGQVIVSNGVYDSGGALRLGITNRVVVDRSITLKSQNGPSHTIIVGNGGNQTGYVSAPSRGAYISEGSRILGFTVTNGATPIATDITGNGGGIFCDSSYEIVSNCVLTGNSGYFSGGGCYQGTLFNCSIIGNIAVNSHGGGACDAILHECILSGNIARGVGGGTHRSTMFNCILVDNSASNYYGSSCGGGSSYGTLSGCTVVRNRSATGGGVYQCVLFNSILYSNIAPAGANWYAYAIYTQNYNHCCTTPLLPGDGNIEAIPGFVNAAAGDYRLSPSSPCIDAGVNMTWMFGAGDLDKNPRIINEKVDIGAYELVFEASLKAILQGPYNTNTHRMAASLASAIPTNAPYAADPRPVMARPTNAVDWVLVQLRRETNSPPVFSRSTWIGDDGTLLSDAGDARVILAVGTGAYHIVLGHRSHLATMSAGPLTFTNRLFSYDFSTSADQNYGGTNGAVQLEPGVWGLWSGDADGDGEIGPADESIRKTQGP